MMSRIDATIVYKVGETLPLTMLIPRQGKMPVGRTKEGIVCRVQSENTLFFEYGTEWLCTIITVEPTKLIVIPYARVLPISTYSDVISKIDNVKVDEDRFPADNIQICHIDGTECKPGSKSICVQACPTENVTSTRKKRGLIERIFG